MKVISLGIGRTGTYSLKLALTRLGTGACHHMEEALKNAPTQVPPWMAAAQGNADWRALYAGYECATDWPTAAFARELAIQYPDARFILKVIQKTGFVDGLDVAGGCCRAGARA